MSEPSSTPPRPRRDSVTEGSQLPPMTLRVRRADLVRYAGASGDFNPIHWNERAATAAGLPDVIAHGMYTMGLAIRAVTGWAGDPGALVGYSVRFIRPVVVPDTDEGADLDVRGVVKRVSDDGVARVDLTVTSDGSKVLGQAQARVRLA